MWRSLVCSGISVPNIECQASESLNKRRQVAVKNRCGLESLRKIVRPKISRHEIVDECILNLMNAEGELC